ncbi:hypothetical protein AMECASPLE_033579, partial [Ameca splendens]
SRLYFLRKLRSFGKLIKKAGSVLGTLLEIIVLRRILHKMKNIMENPEHPLHETVLQQQSVFSQRHSVHCLNHIQTLLMCLSSEPKAPFNSSSKRHRVAQDQGGP